MAKNDIRIRDSFVSLPTVKWQTEANTTVIYAGEPVKLKAAGSPYVIKLADAEPVIGTTTQVIGIAATDSTQTAAADGSVMIYTPVPGVIYEVKAKSAAAADTQSEIDAICGDCLLIDLNGTSYTLDTAAGHVITGGFQVVGGDPSRSVLYVTLRPAAAEGAIA